MSRVLVVAAAAAIISHAFAAYTEPYRPQFHFTPESHWMNDPNGLVFHNGTYHLFFQYNPTGITWGNMSWGHATSSDLVHWTEQPIALNAFDAPSGPLSEFYFSGSAVFDAARTSGLGADTDPPLVALYTSNYMANLALASGTDVLNGQQAQSLAYSTDGGTTWTEYAGNPVIALPPSAYADQYQNFRDPFVFWYEPGAYWVMVVSLANLHKLLIYTSTDLTAWQQASEFGPVNAVGGQWECPGLFPLAVDNDETNLKWVLMIGVNPGDVAIPSGSGTQYIVGTFDGKTFTADPDSLHTSTLPTGELFEGWNETSFAESSWTPTDDFVGRGPSDGQVLTLWDLGDAAVGTLTSASFTISHNYISFEIGCCYNPYDASTAGTPADTSTTINLIVGDQVVRTTTGVSGGDMRLASWDVQDLHGCEATVQLVDRSTGAWGHLDVGQIVFSDTPPAPTANWVDYGPDWYAAATYNDVPSGRRLAIGWMNDWAYGGEIPTSPWRSAMSLPRELTLRTIAGAVRLVQTPVSALAKLTRRAPYTARWQNVRRNRVLPVSGKALEIALSFAPNGSAATFGLSLRVGGTQETLIGYDAASGQLYVDRTRSGNTTFNTAFPGTYSAPLAVVDGVVAMHVLLDWSSVEVFGGQGEAVITAQIFPDDAGTGVGLFAGNGGANNVSITVTKVSSIW